MKKRIGVWVRDSTIHQQQSESPEHHLQKVKMYAELKDWEIAEEYHPEAVSGKSVIDHHQAQRRCEIFKVGILKLLSSLKLHCFAYNVKELLEFSKHF